MKALDIVIFGGTGDLCLRKLMPALYFLHGQGKMAPGSRIIALSRGRMDRDEFRALVLEKLQTFLGAEYEQGRAEAFSGLLDYRDLDIADDKSWDKLSRYLTENGLTTGDMREVIYYMAVPPALFGTVCEQLGRQGLNQENSRLVVEKPLGEDEQSAEAVNTALSASFREDQIYRIDHYLGKEAIQNILTFRFEDGAMEGIWNRDHIDNIQITVAEMVGVEGRANFLDRVGILRDMIQNHLMQILCFLAMDKPESLRADDIRDRKVRVVEALSPVTSWNIDHHVVRAQYGSGLINGQPVPAYVEEIKDKEAPGVGETFVALKALLDNDRWRGVPFYLRTGKRLSGRFAQVVIQFKEAGNNARPDRVIINIQPEMTLYFDDRRMETVSNANGCRIPDAYEKLLGDVILGNQAYFVRHDEIIASWRWIGGIRRAWVDRNIDMHNYTAGSMGPQASDDLLARSGHQWFEG
ncbi:Glucose-6-phosphate 1-dehydrogenase [hydrothermal vent metagenome]|uniref:Glucose-6-phosphate 1-dehydrogenase n=1 Tax=hydrothermal vent metagenome TaxID=652676 RepID=A0A3B0SD96_9ZZZZ